MEPIVDGFQEKKERKERGGYSTWEPESRVNKVGRTAGLRTTSMATRWKDLEEMIRPDGVDGMANPMTMMTTTKGILLITAP